MVDTGLLRLSATLLLTGEALSAVLQFPHPAGGPRTKLRLRTTLPAATGPPSISASSLHRPSCWRVCWSCSLRSTSPKVCSTGWGSWGPSRPGLPPALAAVLYAVDGVALKQAVDAWASAPAREKATRLASAEVIRWLEWGTNGYWNFMQGLALLLYGTRDRMDRTSLKTARIADGSIRLSLHRSGLADWNLRLHASQYSANLCRAWHERCLDDWLLIIAWRKSRSQRHKP
jgi:hypothetical protein